MVVPLPWDRAPHWPWRMVTSPLDRWAVMPSFVIGEALFIACASAALWHALGQRDLRRKHVLAWALALLAGTTNDLFFMALPLVDNFWQAQATLMLTPRLPLYIPCVYVCFMYFPTVSVWRMGLPRLSRAALTGLAAGAFYAAYDVVGAKFLWWTWHDTDGPIANRILGAPMGSTIFVITFVASFSFLLGLAVDREPAISRKTAAKALLLVCGLATPTMMVQMAALQRLDGGVPGARGLVVLLLAYALLAWTGLRRGEPLPLQPRDRGLFVATAAYFATLVLVMAAFDPASHKSESVHQTVGPCHVVATDITGSTRRKYLCIEDFDEDFSFECLASPPPSGSDWYAICGRPHDNFTRSMSAVAAFGVLGAAVFAYLLGLVRFKPRGDQSPTSFTRNPGG
jgi:hypothetical protein